MPVGLLSMVLLSYACLILPKPYYPDTLQWRTEAHYGVPRPDKKLFNVTGPLAEPEHVAGGRTKSCLGEPP